MLDSISAAKLLNDVMVWLDHELTWGELTAERRAELTQALNAADLAYGCILLGGPRKEVKIGF